MSKEVRLSIEVDEEMRTELKVYTSLTKTSIQAIATDTILNFLFEESKKDGTKYSLVANKELLLSAPNNG